MNRINVIRMFLELAVTVLLLILFPFTWERKAKLFFLFVFTMVVSGRYRKHTLLFYDELKVIAKGFAGFLFCAELTIAWRSATAGKEAIVILIFTIIDFLISVFINRNAHLWFRKRVVKPTIIFGTGKTARKLHHVALANRFSTIDVQAFVDCNKTKFLRGVNQEEVEQQAPVIDFDELDEFLVENPVNTALIAIPEINREDLAKLTRRLAGQVKNVKFLPYTQDQLNYASTIDDFDGLLMISTSHGKISSAGQVLKRMVDITGGLAGLVVLAPVTLGVWFFNRINGDTDPVFFTQDRIGKNGEVFKVYKYRTMVPNAQAKLKQMLEEDPELKKEYQENKKLKDDPRITKAGKVLRRFSIDELPQLLNVLKGDMSLVGPRPYLIEEKEEMGDYYDSVIAFPPGITGMWQTHGRSQVSFERRLELDDFYYHNWTVWLDFTIFMKTLQIVLTGDKGAM